MRARWEAYASSPPTKIGAGTLFYLADQLKPGWRAPFIQKLEEDFARCLAATALYEVEGTQASGGSAPPTPPGKDEPPDAGGNAPEPPSGNRALPIIRVVAGDLSRMSM